MDASGPFTLKTQNDQWKNDLKNYNNTNLKLDIEIKNLRKMRYRYYNRWRRGEPK